MLQKLVAWFRRPAWDLPQRNFAPADLALPFALPVVELSDDGGVSAHRRPDGLVLVSDRMLSRGNVPSMQVVAADFRAWRPVKVLAICDAQKSLLGHKLFFAEFQFEQCPSVDLEAIRNALCLAIDRDPDDIWNQVTSHEAIRNRALEARTFSELIHVIVDLGGQGG